MGDARWETLWAVFHQAAGLVGDVRIAYLNDACDGNAGLRDDIEALLATHRASEPLDDAAATIYDDLLLDRARGVYPAGHVNLGLFQGVRPVADEV